MIFDATVAGRTVRVEVRGRDGRYTVALDGASIEIDRVENSSPFASLLVDGESHEVGVERQAQGYVVLLAGHAVSVELTEAGRGAAPAAARPHGPARLTAPMPGRVVRVLAARGGRRGGAGPRGDRGDEDENGSSRRARRLRPEVAVPGQVETGALLAVVG
jgi:acetyl/propionyl-CoA carboxylase alpha subunit